MPKPAVTLSDLHGDPQNARRHNSRNIEQVQASLQAYGAARSIVIDEDNQIIAGHGVVEAAALAGIERVQVVDGDGDTIIAVRRSGLTRKQKQGLGIADNRASELAEWGADVLAGLKDEIDLGQFWQKDELDAILRDVGGSDVDAEPQVDRAEELRQKWGVETGQLWALGEHRLLCGDSTKAEDVGRVMGGERAQLCFTDPPYNVGKDYGGATDDNQSDDDYRQWSALWFLQSKEVADGVAFTPGAVNVWMWYAIERPKWMCIWVKKNQVSRNGAGGYNAYEPFLCYGKVKVDYDVWEIPVKQEDVAHPVPKTVEAWSTILEALLHDGQLVYDPFLGSGTTLIACERLGRKCRAIEISPGYVAVTLERWATATGKTPVRL